MKSFPFALAVLIGAASASLPDSVHAAPPKSSASTQKAQEDVKKANEAVQQDMKQLAEGQKLLQQAQNNIKAANKNLAAAKEKAEANQERTLGFDKLLADQKTARKELKDASEPVLDALHKTEAYAEAKRKAEAAKARMATKSSDSSSDEKKTVDTATAQETMAVTHLERETIETDPKTKPLKEKLVAADKAVLEARGKIKANIPNDNDVRTAESELEKYRGELRQAQNYVGQLLQKAGYDQAVANKESQEAHLMQLMQRSRSRGRSSRRR